MNDLSTGPPPKHALSPGISSSPSGHANNQHALFTSGATCGMHMLCPTMPTAPGLDHFSRRKYRLLAFCVHTRPRDHHPSMTSPLGCRAAPLGTPTANTLCLDHVQRVAYMCFALLCLQRQAKTTFLDANYYRLFAFCVHTRPRDHQAPKHGISPGMSCIPSGHANNQRGFGTSCTTCGMHVMCPTMPTAPGLDHFS
jgi:hypothetical protein